MRCRFVQGDLSRLPVLVQLAKVVHAEFLTVADAYGLTAMQGRMLGLLAVRPYRMNELAQELGVDKTAVTGLVDRAEARDLVTRERVPGDRRSVQVAVTATGAAAQREFSASLAHSLDDLLAGLREDQRAEFLHAAAAIVATRTAHDGAP